MSMLESLVEDDAEQRATRYLRVRTLHANAWRMQTTAPVGSNIADIARIIPFEDITHAPTSQN